MESQNELSNVEKSTISNESLKGFSLSAEQVMLLEDKHFKILSKPFYRDYPDLNDKSKIKAKLVVPIQLVNLDETEWLANKTSQKVIMNFCGLNLNKWVGYVGEFIVKEQVIAGKELKVIYVKEK